MVQKQSIKFYLKKSINHPSLKTSILSNFYLKTKQKKKKSKEAMSDSFYNILFSPDGCLNLKTDGEFP